MRTPLDQSLTPIRYLQRMTLPPDPDQPETLDREAYRTANLDDPDLAAAYELENDRIAIDVQTFGWAWLFGIIPLMLVVLFLSALLGDWVWTVIPVVWIGLILVIPMLRSGLFHRFASDLPIHLPGHGVYSGARKRWLLVKAGALLAVIVAVDQLNLLGWLREWFVDWVAGLL